MGRKSTIKKRKKKKNTWVIMILTIILIILLVVLWKLMTAKEENEQEQKSTEKETMELPYSIDDGKLEIVSLFQSSIANPDCNEERGEDIASIEVKNQSGQFLASADITVILEDDTELFFQIVDVPADSTVWAFETSNAVIAEQPICKSIECEATYEDETPVMTDELSVEAEGTTVVISNLTDKNLTNIEVSFHCLFDEDVYYGGNVYTYPIDSIQAGENVSLDVSECYLGEAQAVRITQSN